MRAAISSLATISVEMLVMVALSRALV